MRASTQATTFGSSQRAGLPNITGKVTCVRPISGAFEQINPVAGYAGGGVNFTVVDFNASNSNNIYGQSETVTPNNISLQCIIYLGK